ncbi:MAG: chromate resistance protein [Chloroflexi bacterium]|nr:chromate resistance protein [Chloroflexota bacterium]
MKWVTRQGAKVDRVACPWLIARFIDPQAQFLYAPVQEVLEVARRERATPFDTRGADLDHKEGKCTFEVILDRYGVHDPGLQRLANIVHGADIPQDIAIAPESAGLRAFAEGLHATCPDDQRKLDLAFPLYDALYAYCKQASGQATQS